MAKQSIKNLNSYSTGYLEKITSKLDFDTTVRGEVEVAIINATSFILKDEARPVDTNILDENITLKVGMVLTGEGISGSPKVTKISTDELTITIDQPQTIAADTVISFNSANSGLEQYTLSGSTKARSKEDIRLNELIPSEILNYSENGNETGGIRKFIESYYQFMNLEEFLYKDTAVFEDIVIDNRAAFRILDPKLLNNKFFIKDLVKTASFFDENDLPLVVGTGTGTAVPSGVNITLNHTAVLTVGRTYIITNLGGGSTSNITADLNFIISEDLQQASYAVNDTFVATDDGTAGNNTVTDIVVQEMIAPTIEVDINVADIDIANGNNLPGQLGAISGIGKTAIIRNLPSRLNGKKLRMETLLQYYVEGNPSYRLNTIEDSLNINLADEEFLDQMQKEIAPAISKTLNVDKRALYQRIVDFYRVRGSSDSINTFFKLFFGDEEIEVEYPWNNTLKPSEGKWDASSTLSDTFAVTSTISASGASSGDSFGRAIDVYNNTMVVGAPFEDTGASNNGKVYIYTTADNGGTWSEQKAFNSNTTAAADNLFGIQTKVSKDIVAISAKTSSTNTGFVEVWERYLKNDGTFDWAFQAKLEKNVGSSDASMFGIQTQLYHDTDGSAYMAVGAPEEVNNNTIGDTGNTLADGAVYIYKQAGSTWSLVQKLKTESIMFPGGSAIDSSRFGGPWAHGTTFSFCEEYLAVGFSYYGINFENSGAVALYKRQDTGLYVLEKFIIPEQESANQYYGNSVDLTKTANEDIVLAVSKAKGGSTSAEVCLYERSVDTSNGEINWTKTNAFTPPASTTRDTSRYGWHTEINGDNLIVSDPGDDGSGTGTQIGLVYHYEKKNNVWDSRPQASFKSPVSATGDRFGYFFSLNKTEQSYLVIGQTGQMDGVGSTNGNVITLNRPILTGSYLDQKGHLSANQKVQDSDFYQKYSYVIKAPRNISQWKDVYNKLVHPAGFKYFGEILIITKMVREILGDSSKGVTLSNNENVDVYSASPAFRKTLSSMPGIQPGYIGVEDLGLLIEAIASVFGPVGIAEPNRDAKLAITSLGSNNSITGISIVETGSGYDTTANNPPTITISAPGGGNTQATATCTVNERGQINNITITNAGTGYSLETATISVQTLTQAGNAGVATSIGADNSTTSGLFFSPFGNKSYTTLPSILIGAPDSRDASNVPSTTNVQAVANFTYTSITAGSFVVGTEYKITAVGNTDWQSIGAPNKLVGTIFRATAVGSGTGTATDMRIGGFIVTEAGLGYINNPRVTITSNSTKEKRVPHRLHKKIIPSNVIDNTISANAGTHMSRTQIANNYYNRKDYSQSSFLNGIKKFSGNYNIRDFSDIQIQNMSGITSNTVPTNINKNNIQTTIDIGSTNSNEPG